MQRTANVTSGDGLDWHAIEWKRVYRTVKNLRQRLFRASREESREMLGVTSKLR
jgi:hypothetical protein